MSVDDPKKPDDADQEAQTLFKVDLDLLSEDEQDEVLNGLLKAEAPELHARLLEEIDMDEKEGDAPSPQI